MHRGPGVSTVLERSWPFPVLLTHPSWAHPRAAAPPVQFPQALGAAAPPGCGGAHRSLRLVASGSP